MMICSPSYPTTIGSSMFSTLASSLVFSLVHQDLPRITPFPPVTLPILRLGQTCCLRRRNQRPTYAYGMSLPRRWWLLLLTNLQVCSLSFIQTSTLLFSRTKTVANQSVSSPVLTSSPRKRPHASHSAQSSPPPTTKRTKHLKKGGRSGKSPYLTLPPHTTLF